MKKVFYLSLPILIMVLVVVTLVFLDFRRFVLEQEKAPQCDCKALKEENQRLISLVTEQNVYWNQCIETLKGVVGE